MVNRWEKIEYQQHALLVITDINAYGDDRSLTQLERELRYDV